MKKRIALITVSLLLVALIAACFIPVTAEKRVIIRASMLNTTRELSKPAEWLKWQPALTAACAGNTGCSTVFDSAENSFSIKAPQSNILVTSRGPIFTITETGNNPANYVYTVIPSIEDDSTSVLIETKQNLLQSLFTSFSSKPYPAKAIDSLKSFMETPERYYGFKIEMHAIIDSNVVAITQKTSVANRVATLHSMQAAINNYISANQLIKLPVTMVHYQQSNNDSLEMMMGVPVNKTAKPAGNVSCMQLTPKGRMVMAYYKGSFAGRADVYKAVQRYMSDRQLRPVAASFERYTTNAIPENDSSQIEMVLCSPVL